MQTLTTTRPAKTDFAWLLEDDYHLRGNLRDVRSAIRRGQFDGPENADRRTALLAALTTLQSRDDLSPRVWIGLARIYAEII